MSLKLIQFPWSTYCMVTRWILKFGDIPHEVVNIPPLDRSLAWEMTKHKSYGVPLIEDEGQVVCERDHDSQVIAKHLDNRFDLGLFPAELEGQQMILWRYIENEVEDPAFRLNDLHYEEWLPEEARLPHLQYKERRFGKGCVEQWRGNRDGLLAQLTQRLEPFEAMLVHRPYMLDQRPRFADLDLAGMLECFLWSGRFELPASLPLLHDWHKRISKAQVKDFA